MKFTIGVEFYGEPLYRWFNQTKLSWFFSVCLFVCLFVRSKLFFETIQLKCQKRSFCHVDNRKSWIYYHICFYSSLNVHANQFNLFVNRNLNGKPEHRVGTTFFV